MDTTPRKNRRGKLLFLFLPLLLGVFLISLCLAPAQAEAKSAGPSNQISMYEVYSTYFFFNPGLNYNADTRTYMEYRKAGDKTWKTYDTAMLYMQDYTIEGLKPNTKYQTRLYFKSIWSDDTSEYSNTVSFKTGPKKKPPVKSASVKAKNVKKHKATAYGAYTGLPLGKYNYYTYKLKITVKFKKKITEPYVFINGKRYKGGKKSYTYTTGKLRKDYNKPKGDKYTVYVYTGNSAKWGGYSLLWQKTYKIK